MIGERIKKLRKALDLTQQEFSERIGIKRNTIAKYETYRGEPIDAVISLICREFNVSEEWMRTGEGEMFLAKPTAALDMLVAEHRLSSSDYILIEKFLALEPESRKAMVDYMRDVVTAITAMEAKLTGDSVEIAPSTPTKSPHEMTDAELHAELDRQLAEEKAATESPSAYGPGKSGTVAG